MPRRLAREGFKHCHLCDKRIRAVRQVPHPQTVECFTRRVVRSYRDMGWVPAGIHGPIIAYAGLDAELAPTGTGHVGVADAPDPWRTWERERWISATGSVRGQVLVEIPCDAWWAPREYVAAALVLTLVRATKVERSEAIRRILVDPEFAAALEAARALDGAPAVEALVRATVGGRRCSP